MRTLIALLFLAGASAYAQPAYPVSPGGGATGPPGPTGTASNVGTQGTGIFKQVVGSDFQFYKIASANNLITVDLSGTDFARLTLNPANFVNLTLSGSLTRTGFADGCANWTSGVLGTTGTACGAGVGGSGTVTSVAMTVPSWLAIAGSPVTTSGTLAVTAATGQVANRVLASPNGVAGPLSVRALVAADVPQALTANALAADPADCLAGQAASGINATGVATGCIDLAANYQQIDGELISLAAETNLGLYSHTAAGVVDTRTIVGTPNEITVVDGNGVAANPTISFPSIINLTSKALLLPNNTVRPPNCLKGQIFIDTDAPTGAQTYVCETADTWVVQGGGGTGPSGPPTAADLVTVITPGLDACIVPTVSGSALQMPLDKNCLKSLAWLWTGLHTFDLGFTDVKRVTAPANPASGYLRFYADNADGQMKCKDASGASCLSTGTGGATWGTITGTLSSQTDLNTALNAKQPLNANLTTFGGLTCTSGQIAKITGSAWTCGTDATAAGGAAATKYTVAFGALASTDSPVVVALAANQVITKCLAKHSAAFTGGGLTSVLVSVGTVSKPDLFCPLVQTVAAPSATVFAADSALGKDTFASDNVIAHFICAGAACSTATTGSLDIYLWIETLP